MTGVLNPKDWTDVAALIGLLTIPLGVVWGYVKFRLGHVFASRAAHVSLSGQVDDVVVRVAQVETAIAGVPTQGLVGKITERVSSLEVAMAQLGGDVRAVRDGVVRVERMVEMLVKNELEEGKRP
jgi:hypothetical protein